MNKYQEALDNLVKHSYPERTSCNECDMKEYCNRIAKGWIDTLQELVDKATPKKPMDVQTPVVKWGICPNCKGKIGYQLGGKPNRVLESQNYCSGCGQALDWSEEE